MKIIILYATAGHGHKKSAEYIYKELLRRKEATDQFIDVDCHDILEYTPPHFQVAYPTSYEFMVSTVPWVWRIGYGLTNIKWIARLIAPLRRLFNKVHSFKLEKFLIEQDPDVVVVTHFFAPEVIGSMKRRGLLKKTTLVTLLTDYFPHSTWINKGTDQYVVMTDIAKEAIKNWGVDEKRIHVLGIPVAPKFQPQNKKDEYRVKDGLCEKTFTVLITAGSFGIGPTEQTLEDLRVFGNKIQVLVVCGHNSILKEKLDAKTYPFKTSIFGFVDNMDELMEASDLVVSKTGGLTTTESLVKEVPMVVSQPIPGQEEGNARFLEEKGACFKIDRAEDMHRVVEMVLKNPSLLDEKVENIKKIRKPNAAKDICDFILSCGKVIE